MPCTSLRLLILASACAVFQKTGFASEVFVLHSYPPNTWTEKLERGIKAEVLQTFSDAVFKTYHFHSEYWAGRNERERSLEVKKVVGLIEEFRTDVVVICDDEASDAFAIPLARLPSPKVFVGINRVPDSIEWWPQRLAYRMTGVLEIYPVLAVIRTIAPRAPVPSSFSILTSDSPTSRWTIQQFETPEVREALSRAGISLRKVSVAREWESWKEAVEESNRQDQFLWFLIPFNVFDLQGQEVTTKRMSEWLKQRIQTLGVGARSLSDALQVSVGVNPHGMGREAGMFVSQLLKGALVSNLFPVESSSYEIVERKEVKPLKKR